MEEEQRWNRSKGVREAKLVETCEGVKVQAARTLLLGVFEKVENCLSLVDLTAKPNNRLFRGFNRLFL